MSDKPDTPATTFHPVETKPSYSVCVVTLNGVEIARATYSKDMSIIQTKREGVPRGTAAMFRRIARDLGAG